MKTPGITVRPLVNMLNSHEFNEVYFEDVRIPASTLLGEENRGWYLATTTLDFERTRGFRRQVPAVPGDSVDLLNPVPGQYGPVELRGISPKAITQWGLFVENSLALTQQSVLPSRQWAL